MIRVLLVKWLVFKPRTWSDHPLDMNNLKRKRYETEEESSRVNQTRNSSLPQKYATRRTLDDLANDRCTLNNGHIEGELQSTEHKTNDCITLFIQEDDQAIQCDLLNPTFAGVNSKLGSTIKLALNNPQSVFIRQSTQNLSLLPFKLVFNAYIFLLDGEIYEKNDGKWTVPYVVPH